jgi:hypothetical protein
MSLANIVLEVERLQQENARLRGQLVKALAPVEELMLGTTVSCSGLDITIACHDHDTKDAIMAMLTDE